LGIGITVEIFQMVGMSELLIEWLKRAVRYCIPSGPRCLRWRAVSWSGPGEVEFPEALMASATLATVKGFN
jgi:hypothetical protein